jgi:hypothetical protein
MDRRKEAVTWPQALKDIERCVRGGCEGHMSTNSNLFFEFSRRSALVFVLRLRIKLVSFSR